MFSRLGAEVVSADRIVHGLLREDRELISSVATIFGPTVLAPDGSIDRSRLAAVVFADRDSLRKLTDVLYPKVRLEIRRVFEETERRGPKDVCVAEVPLLIEGGALDLYDVIVVVAASYRNQLKRFLLTGGTKADLDRRVANQMDLAEKVKLADYVIDNDGAVEQTLQQVRKVYEDIRLRRSGRRLASSKLIAHSGREDQTNKAKPKSDN